ncbi:MAG: transposase [Rhodospirillales bacterium]|nr:MAG: transposase [Rhodospirillales bacterium]
MTETARHDAWQAGDSYDAYMGRWSRLVAPRFLDWLAAPAGKAWLEVGCGTGALSAAILARCAPAGLLAIDASAGFVGAARAAIADPRATFETGDAADGAELASAGRRSGDGRASERRVVRGLQGLVADARRAAAGSAEPERPPQPLRAAAGGGGALRLRDGADGAVGGVPRARAAAVAALGQRAAVRGRGMGGIGRLAVWLVRAGVRPERIAPGRPQQNGRHERLHLTVQQDTVLPVARDRREQQRRFAAFTRMFNEERPHEALDMATPSKVWSPSPRPWDGELRAPEYPAGWEARAVRSNGEVRWGGEMVFLSETLAGETVGFEPTARDGVWVVRYGPMRLAAIDAKGKVSRLRRGVNPPAQARPGPPAG